MYYLSILDPQYLIFITLLNANWVSYTPDVCLGKKRGAVRCRYSLCAVLALCLPGEHWGLHRAYDRTGRTLR
jgi:hypothetical protein